jgi:chitinase
MKKIKDTQVSYEPQRRLSLFRLLIAIILLAGVSYGSVSGWKWWQNSEAVAAQKPWFAAYVDVTSTPTYGFEQITTEATKHVVLSFIVSSHTDPCTPTWGSAYTLEEANKHLDLERRIARLKQQEGSVAISFGGLLNDELAVKCTDHKKLLAAYESVVQKYDIDTIDLDLENTGLTNREAAERRAKVIAELQKKRRTAGKSLAVWVTLPVAPHGLTEDGTNAVSYLLKNGVDLAGVNVMTMNYSHSRASGDSMQTASEKALIQTHRQLSVLYKQAEINLSSKTIWKKIGATPMIGQNDIVNEVFTLEDAQGFNEFALKKGVGRMSMWSANRDIQCGNNYIDTKVVSDSCSGVTQQKLEYSILLSKNFDGTLKENALEITKNDPNANKLIIDDPAKSPYQIWKEAGAYLQGTKVVWKGNVYEAKWWTKGDMPDDPVLQSWQTPWQLIGPVLPNEKPIPQVILPVGTYPTWSGTDEYQTGDRVLFEGTPYQSKWWNQGESPAAASSNADSSPWVPLTQAEILKIIENPNSYLAPTRTRTTPTPSRPSVSEQTPVSSQSAE